MSRKKTSTKTSKAPSSSKMSDDDLSEEARRVLQEFEDDHGHRWGSLDDYYRLLRHVRSQFEDRVMEVRAELKIKGVDVDAIDEE